jgi:hypothetical protein
MIRRLSVIFFLFTAFIFKMEAQELNCIVTVATPQIQSSDKKIYETMQAAIYEFMNSKKWTNYTYSEEEKIECTILITISERTSDVFKGTIQVQSRRPIYKSSYNSVMLNLIDKDLQFNYVEYQTLDYNDNSFTSNLTSLLAYYAYIIIGYDFDSYQIKGGTTFFEKAQTIVTNAQNASEVGWKAFESLAQNNRYWLVENLLNNIYAPIREANYSYHRKGLDQMVDNAATAKTSITAAFELLKKAHEEKPGSYLMTIFFISKVDEIVNIYSNASATDKTKVSTICKAIDPSNSTKYNQITK